MTVEQLLICVGSHHPFRYLPFYPVIDTLSLWAWWSLQEIMRMVWTTWLTPLPCVASPSSCCRSYSRPCRRPCSRCCSPNYPPSARYQACLPSTIAHVVLPVCLGGAVWKLFLAACIIVHLHKSEFKAPSEGLIFVGFETDKRFWIQVSDLLVNHLVSWAFVSS